MLLTFDELVLRQPFLPRGKRIERLFDRLFGRRVRVNRRILRLVGHCCNYPALHPPSLGEATWLEAVQQTVENEAKH